MATVWYVDETYDDDAYDYLFFKFVDITGLENYTKLFIEFYHCYDFESGYDGGNVLVSDKDYSFTVRGSFGDPYNDASIAALNSQPGFTGKSDTTGGLWQKVILNVSDFLGKDSISVAWKLGSDGTGVDTGWRVDDFRIFAYNPTPTLSGLSGDDSITTVNYTDSSGWIKLQYELYDTNDATCAVKGYYNSGSWQALAAAYSWGDTGTVSAEFPTVDRTIYWDAKGQIGPPPKEQFYDVMIVASDPVSSDTIYGKAYLDSKAPTSPGPLAVTDSSQTTADLSWAVTTETNFSHYELYYGLDRTAVLAKAWPALEWDDADDSELAIKDTTSTKITALIPGSQYYFRLWAVDAYGNEGVTNLDSVFTLPTTAPVLTGFDPSTFPQILQVNPDSVFIGYEVDDSDNDTVDISVEYRLSSGGSWILIDDYIWGDTGKVLTNPTANDSVWWNVASFFDEVDAYYDIQIIADDGAKRDTADASDVLIDTRAPQGFTGFGVSSKTASSVTLAWNEPTDNGFDHYAIYYKDVLASVESRISDSCTNAGLDAITTTSTTITGLSSNTTYYFKIWAVDQFGREAVQATVSAFTGIAPITALPWYDNVENSFSEWTPDDAWSRGKPGAGNYSSFQYVWSLDAPYASCDTVLVSQPWVLNGSYEEVTFSWWHKYDMDKGTTSLWDGGMIELDTGSNTWLNTSSARGYLGVIEDGMGNPLEYDSAWSGVFAGGRDSITISNATIFRGDRVLVPR